MAIINEGGGALSTGSAATAVTVEKTQQVYGITIPISSGQRAIYGRVVWMDKPVAAIVVDVPPGGDPKIPPAGPGNSDPGIPIDGKGHGIGLGQWHYDVTVDFAVAFGYHLAPAADRAQTGVLRMWANDKLIFDASDPSLQTDGVDFQFYDGGATQGVDSAIAADRGTLTPGFHNLIYVRFSKWHTTISQISNDIQSVLPVIKIEMVDGLTVSTEEHSFTMLASSTIWERGTDYDWENDTIYAISDASGTPTYIHSFSIEEQLELGKIPITGSYFNLLGFNQISVFDKISGCLITGSNGIGNTTPIVAIKAQSGVITGTFGDARLNLNPSDSNGNVVGTGNEATAYPWPVTGDMVYVNDLEQTQGVFAFSDTFNDLCLLPIGSDGSLPAKVGTEVTVPALTSTTFGDPGQRVSIALLSPASPVASLSFPSAITFVKGIDYPGGVSAVGPGQDGAVIVGVGSKIYTVYFGLRAGQIEIAAVALGHDWGAGHLASQALIDPNDSGLVIFERTTGGSNLWTATKFRNLWPIGQPSTDSPPKSINWRGRFPEAGIGDFIGTTVQILWQVSVPAMSDEYSWQNAMHQSDLSRGTFAWKTPGGSNTTILNLANGSTTTVAFSPSTTGAAGDFAWDSRQRRFYYPSHGGGFARELWTGSVGYASGATKTIGDYLRWIALKIGFLDVNIYVDPQLTDPVIGMLIDHAYNSGTLFNDLGMLYDFQYFESENKIKFVRAPRGDSAPAVTYDLTTSDLVKVNENTITENDLFVTSLGEPASTVANVTVGYDDFNLDYNWATQTYIVDKKTSGAVGTGSLVLQTPVVMTRKEAYKRASRVAVRENASSDKHFFRLSQKFMRLEPSDVIAVTIPPFRYKVRIDEGTLNADWTTSYSGINYSYQDNIPDPTDTHVGVMDTSFGANDAKPLVFDIPLLYTNLNTTGVIMMVGVQSYAQANFAGSNLFAGVAPPGILAAISTFPAGATAGILVGNCLPATTTPFQTDETSVVTVALRTGTSADFDSTDATGLLDGSNAILVGAAGRYEYIFFRDVTVVNAKVVKLSGLERGRRGTDVMTDLHEGGDQVVLVKSVADNFVEPLQPQFLGSDAIGTVERYQAHGAQNVRVVVTLDVGIRGYSLAPWDPVQQNMVLGSTINAFASPDYGNLCGGGGNATPSGVDRRKYITVSGSPIARPTLLVDGNDTNGATNSAQYFVSVSNATILYDFHKSGFKQRITELQWVQNTTHNQGNYDFEGSNDGVAWTSIATNFDLVNGLAVNTTVFTNVNYYWYYRLRQVSGTTSIFPWLKENYFKIVADAAANDLLIRWIRRDRVGGEDWLTVAQPMSEATEQYDLEIMSGDTIVRTVSGLTLPQYTYLAADQSTDGFSPPLASLRIKVYQVSAISGRGFVGDATIFSA